jgi:hypothetical protein
MNTALIIGGPHDGKLVSQVADFEMFAEEYVLNSLFDGQHLYVYKGLYMRDAVNALAAVYNKSRGMAGTAVNVGHVVEGKLNYEQESPLQKKLPAPVSGTGVVGKPHHNP